MLGVEIIPDPFQISLMLWMVGIVDRLQQILVSDSSAYVFRWAGAGARKADRVTHTCLRGKNVFDEELMRLQIAEIVLVGKPRGLPRDDIL